MKLAIPDHLLRVPPLEALLAAKEIGCDGIELTASAYTIENHPLLGVETANTLAQRAAESGVTIASVSASFVTRWGLIDPQAEVRQKSVSLIERLLEGCQAAAVPVLHVPCQGASEPQADVDQQRLLDGLRPLGRRAAEHGVTLALDTLEPADACRAWLTALDCPGVTAAYDVGNARAANRDVVAELQLLGDTLAQVRLRDRARREPFPSVLLGEGAVDWPSLFRPLKQRSFAGWLILEGPGGNEARGAARRNVAFVKQLLA